MASKIALKAQQSPKDQGSISSNNNKIGLNPNSTLKGGETRRQCLCSPTTHKGSFRCRLHRSVTSMYRTKSIPSTPPSAALADSQVS
ncbi:serine-rich protein-like protein [Rhynchospora pubera]|uniref:Serine-rich protein-like protein n=1 Tax=Rhynchospora pubera TaxID=906938 RepID=A0AAV8CCP4_9POAL|nr:serine-rich protein-like protein [Rhynchospora pubera]KAJ4794036.1 serine-rich protein-like protein [Rhynchospora pubera]